MPSIIIIIVMMFAFYSLFVIKPRFRINCGSDKSIFDFKKITQSLQKRIDISTIFADVIPTIFGRAEVLSAVQFFV